MAPVDRVTRWTRKNTPQDLFRSFDDLHSRREFALGSEPTSGGESKIFESIFETVHFMVIEMGGKMLAHK